MRDIIRHGRIIAAAALVAAAVLPSPAFGGIGFGGFGSFLSNMHPPVAPNAAAEVPARLPAPVAVAPLPAVDTAPAPASPKNMVSPPLNADAVKAIPIGFGTVSDDTDLGAKAAP